MSIRIQLLESSYSLRLALNFRKFEEFVVPRKKGNRSNAKLAITAVAWVTSLKAMIIAWRVAISTSKLSPAWSEVGESPKRPSNNCDNRGTESAKDGWSNDTVSAISE